MRTMRVSGIALALSVASVLNFLLLFFLLEKKIGSVKIKGILSSMLKSALSAILMGGAILIFLNKVSFDALAPLSKLGTLGAVILAGIAVYALSSLIFNRSDLKNMMDLFSKKKILKE
jgi:putative peptidoglycan lipid II flippase